MAPAPPTPRRTATGRRRGRPPGSTNAARAARLAAASSEPPPKRRKYIPGGPGGGGRFVDEDGVVTEIVSRGNGRGPRIPSARRASHLSSAAILPRRERSTRTRTAVSRYEPDDEEQFSSAAAVAAAVVQSEGYKPREERGWEEFHPNLDIDTTFMVFSADCVDGTAVDIPAAATDVLACTSVSAEDGTTTEKAEAGDLTTALSPTSQNLVTNSTVQEHDGMHGLVATEKSIVSVATPGFPQTPLRRRIGRPPRDLVGSLVASTPKTPKVLPIHNQTPKERLDLKMPSFRKTDRIQMFEGKTLGRYVDKSMMNVGYQESDIYIRPEHYLIKASDSNAEEDMETHHHHQHTADGHTHSHTLGSGGGVGRVEYDMDEQDDKWLTKYNIQRKENVVEPITREIFEITITKIEKEWHALEKRIPKPNPKPPQTHRPRSSSAAAVNGETQGGEEQDSKCAICDDGDCENTNAIVFCDGCDLAVHQDCYGVPFIPEGQWLCRKCQLIGRGVPTCIFCPNTDGAFKQTNSSKWAHMLCAMWIPETSLGNTTFMEPVMDVEKVPKTRWRLTCYICRQKMGACIQCGSKACYQAFHVTCARRARLYLKMKNSQGALAVLDNSMVLKAFCDRHCPPDYAKENAVHQATRDAKRHYKRSMRGRIWADSQASALHLAATHLNAAPAQLMDVSQITASTAVVPFGSLAGGAVDLDSTGGDTGDAVGSVTSSTGGALAADKKKASSGANGQPAKPTWKLSSGAPVIPQAVFDIVETSLQRFMLRRRREFVSEACRYWTLKREARRGAALLKRLQLQMETFTSMELTRRNFAAMGPTGKSRLQRRIDFAEMLIQDLFQLRSLADDVVNRERDKQAEAELELDFVNTCYFPIYQLLAPVVEKASAYDKDVFQKDFAALQRKLDDRYYTNALGFVRDLCDAIYTRINQTNEPEHEQTGASAAGTGGMSGESGDAVSVLRSGSPLKVAAEAMPAASLASKNASTLYAGARDRKRLGKRILKAIQPMLEAAVRAEADIARVAPEPLIKEMEALLEASVELQQTSITVSQAAVSIDSEHMEDVVVADGGVVTEANADQIVVAKEDGEEMDVDLDPTSGLDGENEAAKKATALGGTGEFLVNGGSADGPLTPPQSHSGSVPGGITAAVVNSIGDGASGERQDHGPAVTLNSGGVLWYLDGFSLDGTTAVEEQWSGREAVRSLSEDLTDMDEEELNGLAFDVEDNTITASALDAAVAEVGAKEAEAEEAAQEDTVMVTPPTSTAPAPTVTTPRRRNNGMFRKGTRSSARRR